MARDEVEFPTNPHPPNPMVDVSVLKNGNIGTLMDIRPAPPTPSARRWTATPFRCCPRPFRYWPLSATGGVTEEDAERGHLDHRGPGLSVKYIVMRGRRF